MKSKKDHFKSGVYSESPSYSCWMGTKMNLFMIKKKIFAEEIGDLSLLWKAWAFPDNCVITGVLSRLVFISHSSNWKLHLVNCEGAKKLTIPREATHLHKVLNFFLFPATEFQRTVPPSSSKDLFPRIWNLSTGFRCVLCYIARSYTSDIKNLERQ